MIINKAYIKLENKKNIVSIEDIILNYLHSADISYEDDIMSVSTTNNDAFELLLHKIHNLINEELNINITILIIPFFDDIFKKYLTYIPNEVSTIFNVFIKNINDKNVEKDSKTILNSIEKKDLDTIKAFLMCNGNSCASANELYLHRNSFNYRMNCFMNSTSLDVRDLNTLMFIRLLIGINK